MIFTHDVNSCNNNIKIILGVEDASSSTFQLIAFLLTVLNIISLLISNASSNTNNNINNNNLNDNSFNGNGNDINENNSNAEVNAMNIIPPGKKKRRRR